MKWSVIGFNLLGKRFHLLNEAVQAAIPGSQLEIFDTHPVDFNERLKEVLRQFDQIRIDSPFGLQAIRQFKRTSMAMNSLQSVDCIIKREGDWWPECCLFTAFNHLLSTHGHKLDVAGEVIVVGAGSAARAAIAAILRAGFRFIRIANKYDDEGLTLIEELKRRFLSCRFEYVPQDRLVLLPGTSCLLVNTTPLVPSNDLLNELTYLNFLKRNGMIWDLVISPVGTPLIKEGEQINVQCVSGAEIAALTDHIWLGRVGIQSISVEDLKNKYHAAFKEVQKSD